MDINLLRKMKNKTILLALSILFFGCETKNAKIESTDITIGGRQVNTYTIDSCEYIGNLESGDGNWAAHKGNCKYCAARRKSIQ